MRGSDPDSALYWMVRMIEGGEDPLLLHVEWSFLRVRMWEMPMFVLSLWRFQPQSIQFIGMPEARIALGQVCTYSMLQSPMLLIRPSMRHYNCKKRWNTFCTSTYSRSSCWL